MKLSPQQKRFILENEQTDVRELALRIDKKKSSDLDSDFLLKQIAGRQIARRKIPSWYANDAIIYPVHLSLEQASSEATAVYKASLIPRSSGRFVDLTGGLGVDFAFLSKQFGDSTYVEQNVELCEIAKHNFRTLELQNTTVIHGKGEEYVESIDFAACIYLDPARRDDAGRKVVSIEDCTPDLSKLQNQLIGKSKLVLVKYSPMLDISRALQQLENVAELHVVSVDNECRELLFLLVKDAELQVVTTINMKNNGIIEEFKFSMQEEKDCDIFYADRISRYLYEPNASVLKAGAFKTVSKRFNLHKLHKSSHLYTSDELKIDFPGRVFEVRGWFVANRRNIRSFVSQIGKANIAVRNYPMSVAEIRKKTGLKDGGDVYLFATTISTGEKVWAVCRKVEYP